MAHFFEKLKAKAANDAAAYVYVNVGANILVLFRSFATMGALDHTQLGLATLLQMLILLVGTLQFGILNGGFRLMCSEGALEAGGINDLLYTSFVVLAAAWFSIDMPVRYAIGEARYPSVTALGVLASMVELSYPGKTLPNNKDLYTPANLERVTHAFAHALET